MAVELFTIGLQQKARVCWNISFRPVEQNSLHTVTKGNAAQIVADFMTTIYHVQAEAAAAREFRTTPFLYRLILLLG
jgi:hypothetical protein